MPTGTVLVLLGFGIGALAVAGRSAAREPQLTLRQHADTLREQTSQAQETSARASRRARELMDQWSVAEDAARKTGL
jgi:hypothetical protein